MSDLCKFFTKVHKEVRDLIPQGFLDSLLRMYDYTVLQEVKESLYYYNEEQIAREIKNYLFAINFEIGVSATSTYTGEKLDITEDYLEAIEMRLLGPGSQPRPAPPVPPRDPARVHRAHPDPGDHGGRGPG